MATTTELKVDTLYADGDTRLITLKNPKATISAAEITTLNGIIATNNLLIGDKAGAAFDKISTVTKVTKTTTEVTF